MWAEESIFYHIYPLGFCGAPDRNDFSGQVVGRIHRISDHIDHMKNIGINALYLGPLFSSSTHGYDTADYFLLDQRLGSNEDFTGVCDKLHEKKIRIVLDGVFNHVGRHFWAFQDVLAKKQESDFIDWFKINWNGNNSQNDGFSYQCWEGHLELVELNLKNPSLKSHLFEAVRTWIEKFDIDGLRLDVAYSLDHDFIKELRAYCIRIKPDFWLMGEAIHGDYGVLVNPEMLDSVTNYECYKGLYSSCNDKNMFEIAHSLKRQDSLYKGMHLYTFLENHDVTRIASILKDKRDLPLLYTLLFAIPGIPSLYYGGEFGYEGKKEEGDSVLRPYGERHEYKDLTNHLKNLSEESQAHSVFRNGSYKEAYLTNTALCFLRENQDEALFCGINIGEKEEHVLYKGFEVFLPPKSAQLYLNGSCISYVKAD